MTLCLPIVQWHVPSRRSARHVVRSLVGTWCLALVLGGMPDAMAAAEPRIIGGTDATESYPFMTYAHNCGASLIAPTWVVSAAHCYGGKGEPKTVRIGSRTLNEGGEMRTVKRWTRHPSASDSSNDIMVGELTEPSTKTPIPMAKEAPAVGTPTRLLGWGSTNPTPPIKPSPVLQEVNTSILPPAECTKRPSFPGQAPINAANELCTNNPDKKGPCVLDSGGPQIVMMNGGWTLVGITNRSTGGDCGENPSIYASVAAHRPWIASLTGLS